MDLELWRAKLSRLAESLGDANQRVILFTDKITELSPEDACCALEQVLTQGVQRRDRRSRLLLESAMLGLAQSRWPEAHLRKVHRCAQTSGPTLVRILTGPQKDPSADDPDAVFLVPSYGGTRPLTLGERKFVASRPGRQLIEKALGDPHPTVIAVLMNNPKLTEDDAVRIAARRPCPREVLAQIALHPKWRLSRRVARAVIFNPSSPLRPTLTLLPGLDRASLIEIKTNERLAPSIQEAATRLLEIDGHF